MKNHPEFFYCFIVYFSIGYSSIIHYFIGYCVIVPDTRRFKAEFFIEDMKGTDYDSKIISFPDMR